MAAIRGKRCVQRAGGQEPAWSRRPAAAIALNFAGRCDLAASERAHPNAHMGEALGEYDAYLGLANAAPRLTQTGQAIYPQWTLVGSGP